ncbi:hypothetical protein P154DRAFT_110017 [Amniculicola lignicola CBS 123094]|uniref:Uncharacterized protein n=1 Tax=Amniculicola lignicola CBS 123094 TaxID=1392246 RepID=A0A6A5WZV0_9PLEO|nr:hypothetical protein P154DRAFT_110017 [Amniculicola lignicola CBS 123094]
MALFVSRSIVSFLGQHYSLLSVFTSVVGLQGIGKIACMTGDPFPKCFLNSTGFVCHCQCFNDLFQMYILYCTGLAAEIWTLTCLSAKPSFNQHLR